MACGRDLNDFPTYKFNRFWTVDSTVHYADCKSVEEENRFAVIFKYTVHSLQERMKLSNREIEEGIQECRENFRGMADKDWKTGDKWDINTCRGPTVCGYIYRYCPLSAGLCRFKILTGIRECIPLRNAVMEEDLKVVSLGGGPGSDFVGFLSVLNATEGSSKNIHYTIVDKVNEYYFNVLKDFLSNEQFGYYSEMIRGKNISTFYKCMEFDEEDNNPLKDDYKKALNEADIILVSRVFSILPDRKVKWITNHVAAEMKTGSLAVVVDSPYYNFGCLRLISTSSPANRNQADLDMYKFDGQDITMPVGDIARKSKMQISVFMK